MPREAGDRLSLDIQGPDFAVAMRAFKEADRDIRLGLMRAIRKAGAESVAAVKSEIDKIPSSGRYSTGIRAGLRAGTRMQILASRPRSAGIRIVTSPSRLPKSKAPLAKAMNKVRFRHPQWPDPDRSRTSWVWVEQSGRPYFGAAINAKAPQMRLDIVRAMNTAQFKLAERLERANRA